MTLQKKKVVTGLKIILIIFLVMGIAFLALMQWKSDVIVQKIMNQVQGQLEDSIRYDAISLEWVRYFPSAALRIENLKMGAEKTPFIQGGNIDVVVKLFPLLSEKVIINRLKISDSHIYVTHHKGRWTYDLFKKPATKPDPDKAEVTKSDSSKWQALVRQINLENTILHYNDREGLSFSLDVKDGQLDGDINDKLLDADIELKGSLDSLNLDDYRQSDPFAFELTGKYKYDREKKMQELNNFRVVNKGIELEGNGFIRNEPEQKWYDLHVAWNNGDPQVIKSLLPTQNIKNWHKYSFSGNSEGQLDVNGYSSKEKKPHVKFSTELEDGSIRFPGEGGQLKNILLNVAYDNGQGKTKTDSYLRANLRNSSFQGNKLQGDMRMENLDKPVVDAEVKGSLPASMLNFFTDSSVYNFKEGIFDIDHYKVTGLDIKSFSTKTFIAKSIAKLKTEDVKFSYHNDQIAIAGGYIDLDESGKMKVDVDELIWNKAKGEDVDGELIFAGDNVDFQLKGKHSQGEVDAKGAVTGLGKNPVLSAEWKVKGIEMQELLAAFSNFDQTFITSENLKGKADVWSVTTIPYDVEGNIRKNDIVVRAAIDIKDGQLQDMKILEDFSKYVHLDDLRDIRFNQFRNYLKIEQGKVFMPVVFIQSSALNLSINGVHSFDQEILYNMKMNAGQAAATKLKKVDVVKRFKAARKSGWINLYYVLYGTTSDVKYEQDQKQVIAAFEQSSQMKEALRNYLVDKFGHDVYWLEPNEWEDIPEYK